jgi:hypothetical protein
MPVVTRGQKKAVMFVGFQCQASGRQQVVRQVVKVKLPAKVRANP